jgi:hypothetical protein
MVGTPDPAGGGRGWLVFLHIPKTGGKTLEHVLRRQYGSEALYRVKGDYDAAVSRLKRLDGATRSGLRVIHGHMPFGIHEELEEPAVYTAMLRHPVDRVISHYHYAQRKEGHYLREAARSEPSLKRYVETGAGGRTVELDNGQTRALSGERPSEIELGGCTPELLEAAKSNLAKHFGAVGVVERFDESLVVMREAFGWRAPIYVRQNTSGRRRGRGDLDAATRRAIEKRNELDLELYGYATERLAKRMEEISGVRSKVASFRALNGGYNRLRSLRNRLTRGRAG